MHRMERVNSLYSEKCRAVQEVLSYFFCSCCCVFGSAQCGGQTDADGQLDE